VRPGSAVAWLPAACLVGRTTVVRDQFGGFDDSMRVGEDVDLVWRLEGAGHAVRYDPAHLALHDTRSTLRGWLGRKFVYGTGGALLAERHGNLTAPAILSPASAAAAAALLLRRRWSMPVAAVVLAHNVRLVHRDVPGTTLGDAATIGTRGLGWAVRQEAALLMRHWWPLAALTLGNRSVRRAVVTALVVDAAAARTGPTPFLARRLDDLAYGAGLWTGALRRRSWQCLWPRRAIR
jgi:hypothetical protein